VSAVELRGPIEDLSRWREHGREAFIFLEGVAAAHVAELRLVDTRVPAKLRCGGLAAVGLLDG
jgi:hypothetical protein